MMREGWPVALPRLTSRPFGEQNQVILRVVAAVHLVDLGFDGFPAPLLAHVGGVNFVVEVADVADRRHRVLRAWSMAASQTLTLPVAVTSRSVVARQVGVDAVGGCRR